MLTSLLHAPRFATDGPCDHLPAGSRSTSQAPSCPSSAHTQPSSPLCDCKNISLLSWTVWQPAEALLPWCFSNSPRSPARDQTLKTLTPHAWGYTPLFCHHLLPWTLIETPSTPLDHHPRFHSIIEQASSSSPSFIITHLMESPPPPRTSGPSCSFPSESITPSATALLPARHNSSHADTELEGQRDDVASKLSSVNESSWNPTDNGFAERFVGLFK